MITVLWSVLLCSACSQNALDELPHDPNAPGREKNDVMGSLDAILTDPVGTGENLDNLLLGQEYQMQVIYKVLWSLYPAPTFEFSVSKADNLPSSYQLDKTNDQTAKIVFYKPGVYNVTARCTNYSRNEITRSFTLADRGPILTGPERVEALGTFYDFTLSNWDPRYPATTFRLTWVRSAFANPGTTKERATILQDGNRFRVRFDEPGNFYLHGAMLNGPSTKTSTVAVNVYYKPYYRIEQIEIPVTSEQPPLPTDRVQACYRNVVRFFRDPACTIPCTVEHELIFQYYLQYTVHQGATTTAAAPGQRVNVKLAPGKSFYELPHTVKFTREDQVSWGHGITRTLVPEYHIVYPTNTTTYLAK